MANDMKFVGFEPTIEIRALAKELLWSLERRSPSSSSAVSMLSKVNKDFHAILEISSNQGVFKAVSSALNPEDCLQDLYKKALVVIKNWSFSRTF